MEQDEHKLLAMRAADCAERALPIFEEICPNDHRPRKAIEAARAWSRGEIKVGEARKCAFAAHTAARAVENRFAKAAARAAGHAAATAHVPSHSKHAEAYSNQALNFWPLLASSSTT